MQYTVHNSSEKKREKKKTCASSDASHHHSSIHSQITREFIEWLCRISKYYLFYSSNESQYRWDLWVWPYWKTISDNNMNLAPEKRKSFCAASVDLHVSLELAEHRKEAITSFASWSFSFAFLYLLHLSQWNLFKYLDIQGMPFTHTTLLDTFS